MTQEVINALNNLDLIVSKSTLDRASHDQLRNDLNLLGETIKTLESNQKPLEDIKK